MLHWLHRNYRALQFLLFALGCLLLVSAPTQGGVVYLKDGLAIHGKVKREMELMQDPASGTVIPVVKPTNCFLLDDGVRYVIFGLKQVDNVDQDLDIREGQIKFSWPMPVPPQVKLPTQGSVGVPTPINDKWERKVTVKTPQGPIEIKQKVTSITPHSVRIESFRYEWQVNYLTSELGSDVVLPLLRHHPDIVSQPPNFDNHFKIFRFCMQAGWLESANAELQRLRKEFPTEKARIDTAQDQYRQLRLEKSWEEATQAAKAGRHSRAEELVHQLPLDGLPANSQAQAADLRTRYDTMKQKLESARQLLKNCNSIQAKELTDASSAISRELNYDTLDRVEWFTTLARQAEQAERDGKPAKHSKEELLAALSTSWVFGPTATETLVKKGQAAWELRNRLLVYQRTHNAPDRKRLLDAMAHDDTFSISEIAHAIEYLPPAEGAELASPQPGPEAMSRQTKLPFSSHGPFQYRLQLPAEYHPGRLYPVLLVLPNAEQSTAQAMGPWEADAHRHGYILVSVDWGTVKTKYEYSDAEHAAALDCIRDLKRFLQVDPDRVFLTGFGEGANMAFDVGLSHPDLFAGVLPINGRPRWYASQWYWRNAQQLPFYVVCGEFSTDVRSWDANIYERWAEKGYPSLMVVYRGRILEFYPSEIAYAYDWMDRKTRASGFPDLGHNPTGGYQGEQYQTFRESDNRYYWITTERLDPKYTLDEFTTRPKSDRVSAAIQANIRDNNQIQVNTRGVKQLSVWLGRVKDPTTGARDMIDFAKPVKVTINNTPALGFQNAMLTPKLETMLEDFYLRCDRTRLFSVKLDFNVR
ncbi:MAG: hypothetical protein ACJ8C4_16750 [Gemmataceae bacterium]